MNDTNVGPLLTSQTGIKHADFSPLPLMFILLLLTEPKAAPAPPAPETLPLLHLDVSGGIMRPGFISFKEMINLHGHGGAEGQKWCAG